MFSKSTKVTVKDGRMTIMTDDARAPGVTSFPIDHVRSGNFEVSAVENDGHALVFKPSGKKAAETIGVYNSAHHAGKALKAVYKGLSQKGSGLGSFTGGLFRIVGVTALVIVVIAVLLSVLAGFFADDASVPPDGATTISADGTIPDGVPIPVDDYISATQGEGDNPASADSPI